MTDEEDIEGDKIGCVMLVAFMLALLGWVVMRHLPRNEIKQLRAHPKMMLPTLGGTANDIIIQP